MAPGDPPHRPVRAGSGDEGGGTHRSAVGAQEALPTRAAGRGDGRPESVPLHGPPSDASCVSVKRSLRTRRADKDHGSSGIRFGRTRWWCRLCRVARSTTEVPGRQDGGAGNARPIRRRSVHTGCHDNKSSGPDGKVLAYLRRQTRSSFGTSARSRPSPKSSTRPRSVPAVHLAAGPEQTDPGAGETRGMRVVPPRRTGSSSPSRVRHSWTGSACC